MPSVDTLYPVLPRFVQLLSALQYYIYLIKELRNSPCAGHGHSGALATNQTAAALEHIRRGRCG
jgi:hypothetical protein